MAQGDSERVQQALKLRKEDPRKAEKLLSDIISQPPSVTSEAAVKEYETALIALGELYKDEKWVDQQDSARCPVMLTLAGTRGSWWSSSRRAGQFFPPSPRRKRQS